MLKKIKISFYLFLLLQTATAQEVVSVHLDTDSGLPEKRVYDMVEDSLGYIWLATNSGLYRYDGKDYKKFINIQQKGRSVFDLKFDYKGRLWCSNVNGQFLCVENDSLHLGLSTEEVFQIEEKLHEYAFFDKKLFLIRDDRLLAYDLERKMPITYTLSVPTHDKKYTTITGCVANDSLFFAIEGRNTSTCLYVVTVQDTIAQFLEEWKYGENNKTSFRIHRLYSYKGKKMIWSPLKAWKAGTQIMRVDTFSPHPITYPRFFEDIRLIYPNEINQKIWFASSKGVHILDGTLTGGLENERTLFPEKFITKAIKDQNDNYWVSTLYEGIYVIPNLNLGQYPIPDTLGVVLCSTPIADNKIAFGTEKGKLGILHLDTEKIELIPQDEHTLSILKIFYSSQLEELYITTQHNAYSHLYHIKQKKLITLGKIDPSFFASAKALSEMDVDTILVALRNGVQIRKREEGKRAFSMLAYDPSRHKRTYDALYVAQNEKIYAAFLDELIVYNKDLTGARRIHYKDGRDVLAKKMIYTKDGILWAITFDKGLLKIEDNVVTQVYTTANGLLDDNIYQILEDDGFLWLHSMRGIQKFNPKEETFQNLTTQDGFIPEAATGFHIMGDYLYYSSRNQIFVANKHRVFKEPKAIRTIFTSIEINDIPYPIQEEYYLSPNQKKLRVRFNTKGFQTNANTNYQYRIKGLSDKWENITRGVNEVVINRLPEGRFVFELQAINLQGTSSIIRFNIHAKGVFYKQWWFILLCALVVVMAIYFYFQRQIRMQNKRQALALEQQRNETEKVYLKLENIRSQMNPHFVFNALNSIQDYIILNQKNLAGDYLGKFADLIRMYLDQSRKKNITFQEEIDTLDRYLELEKLRFEDQLEYQIIVDKNIETTEINIPPMLLQPYVENAIKHGFLHKKGIGHLEVHFELKDKCLYCTITDDGVGREKTAEIQAKQFRKHTSFSTQAIRDRLELLNHDRKRPISIEIEDLQQPTGTKVTVVIPV